MKTVSSKQEIKIKEYFKKAFNRELSDVEFIEVADSLYYLGKAIFHYKLLHLDKIQSTNLSTSALAQGGTPTGAPTTVV